MVLFVCLKPDGEVREVDKNINNKFGLDETMSLQYLKGVIDNKGKGKIIRLHIWDFCGNKIYIYGWTAGNSEILSNHSLPSPLNNQKCYGDLLCFLVSNNSIIDFTEGFYLDFFQNNWEDEPCEDDDDDDEVKSDDEDDEDDEDNEDIDDENENTIEIVLATSNDELQLEPEFIEA